MGENENMSWWCFHTCFYCLGRLSSGDQSVGEGFEPPTAVKWAHNSCTSVFEPKDLFSGSLLGGLSYRLKRSQGLESSSSTEVNKNSFAFGGD